MKYINYLKLSTLAIILTSGQLFAGPLYDELKPIFENNLTPPTLETSYEKIRVHNDYVSTATDRLAEDKYGRYLIVPTKSFHDNKFMSDEDLQKQLRLTAARFIKTELTRINEEEDFSKEAFSTKLKSAFNLIIDLRDFINPIQNKKDKITELQNNVWEYYNNETNNLYHSFLDATRYVLSKKNDYNFQNDAQFVDIYTNIKNAFSAFLQNVIINSLEIHEATDDLIPFYVHSIINHPKPLQSAIPYTAPLEKNLKATYTIEGVDDTLQGKLRQQAASYFAEQIRFINLLKAINDKIMAEHDHKQETDTDYQYTSLQTIFEEYGFDKNEIITTLLNLSASGTFAALNISPYTSEEQSTVGFSFEQNPAKKEYRQLFINVSSECSANTQHHLLSIFNDADQFSESNRKYFALYYNVVKSLQDMCKAYIKFLTMSVEGNDKGQPALFVQTFNLKQ